MSELLLLQTWHLIERFPGPCKMYSPRHSYLIAAIIGACIWERSRSTNHGQLHDACSDVLATLLPAEQDDDVILDIWLS